ncbi:MAG: PIN domain-containing protein, partial [Terriglobia bacterium]
MDSSQDDPQSQSADDYGTDTPSSLNAFIDTECFDHSGLNFASTVFRELIRFAKQHKVHVVLTSVTVQEVRAHIDAAISNAEVAIERFRKEGRILRQVSTPFRTIFQEFDAAKAREDLHEQLTVFLEDTEAVILDVNAVAPESIFHDYFNSVPPFGSGKKKHEFPDAFSFAAICEWCRKTGENLYVVSGDPDWKAACTQNEALRYVDTLGHVVALLAKREAQGLADRASALYAKNIDRVRESIADEFRKGGFY